MQDARAGGTIYSWTLGKDKSAHDVAREFGHDDAVELPRRHTPVSLLLAQSCERADAAEVQRLLGEHPGITRELTAELLDKLPGAAEKGNARAVDLMLSAGWPVDAVNISGVTALHWAAFHGNAQLVSDLLGKGASVLISDLTYGGTSRDWAEHGAVRRWNRDEGDYPWVRKELSAAATRP